MSFEKLSKILFLIYTNLRRVYLKTYIIKKDSESTKFQLYNHNTKKTFRQQDSKQ